MKSVTFFIFYFTCLFIYSQSNDSITDKKSHFGIAIKNGAAGVLETLAITPSATYFRNNHQVELGLSLYPLEYQNNYDNLFGSELAYKYFPQGTERRLNLFYEVSSFYFHKAKSGEYYKYIYYANGFDKETFTYYSNEHRLDLLGGMGFRLKLLQKGYIEISARAGMLTQSYYYHNSENFEYAYDIFTKSFFDAAANLNLGYRF